MAGLLKARAKLLWPGVILIGPNSNSMETAPSREKLPPDGVERFRSLLDQKHFSNSEDKESRVGGVGGVKQEE